MTDKILEFASPRTQAEALIYRAFQITVAAEEAARDFTSDELEELLHCLTAGAVQVKKLPGAQVATARYYARIDAELARRKTAAVRTFTRSSEDAANERFEYCARCGNHIRDHYGGTEYRCDPKENA